MGHRQALIRKTADSWEWVLWEKIGQSGGKDSLGIQTKNKHINTEQLQIETSIWEEQVDQ